MKFIVDIILFCGLFISTFLVQSTNDKNNFSLPSKFKKNDRWLKEENIRRSLLTYHSGPLDTITLDGALLNLRKEKSYSTFLTVKSWCIRNYQLTFPYLVSMLTDTSTVGLTYTTELIIPGRTSTQTGRGNMVKEDLFRVCGRSSYILNQLTGENFAVVTPSTTLKELIRYQQMWKDWIARLPR